MRTWVEVNGAKIKKEFLEANILEASHYDWCEIHAADLKEHVHCMICGFTIDPKSATPPRTFQSKGGYACDYCHEHFLT